MLAEQIKADPSLLDRLKTARNNTDTLFELIRPEALYDRPIAERHRIIFYIGHLEAFDWNLLQPRLPGLKIFNEGFDRLFAFGIDPVDGGLPSDQPADWPALAEVHSYRDRLRRELDAALEHADPMLLHVAIEHRLMHGETLAYMLHRLPYEKKIAQPQTGVAAGVAPRFGMVQIPAGAATLGAPRDSFGWDNEFVEHRVDVPAFAMDRYKVTNGQYLEFMEAGGYREAALWAPAAWKWITEDGISHPAFWRSAPDGWRYRGMFQEIALPLDWPVYTSHAEASAFARWAGKRLPTEAEWHRAAYGTPEGSERAFPWGADAPGPQHGYFDFARWDPAPVNAFPQARSGFGVEGLLANGWEWTSTEFGPFPGFEAFPFYEGYSANFFDGRHYVMKGGSPRTERCMLRRSFRNWFQPHYPYVYAGFRCVQ